MPTGRTARDFVAKISDALIQAERRGIHVTAGAGSCDLEAQQFSRHTSYEDEQFPAGRPHHLETPPGPRDLGAHDSVSRLCYFLDGAQSSREIGRIGMAPSFVATVCAAIVNRCERRFSGRPMESPPTVVQALSLARGVGDRRVEAFWELWLEAGVAERAPEGIPGSGRLG